MNEKQLEKGLFKRLNYQDKIKILLYLETSKIILNFELR